MLVPLLTYPSVSPGGGHGACLTGPVFRGGWGLQLLFLKNGTLTRFCLLCCLDALGLLVDALELVPAPPGFLMSLTGLPVHADAALVPLLCLAGFPVHSRLGFSWSPTRSRRITETRIVFNKWSNFK